MAVPMQTISVCGEIRRSALTRPARAGYAVVDPRVPPLRYVIVATIVRCVSVLLAVAQNRVVAGIPVERPEFRIGSA